jgi:hypothetical protein
MIGVSLSILVLTGCTSPEATPAPINTTVAAPDETPAPTSESVARADALLEEMKSREAQFKKIESELQRRPTTPIPDMRAPDVASPSRLPSAPPTQAPTAAPAVVASDRDEAWWKQRAHAIEIRLDEAQRQAAAALVAVDQATLRITQDQARADYLTKLAAVNTLRAELTDLQEEARRANVPPGWLRWP